MIMERVERRVLGAIYCLNGVTGLPILSPLELHASGVTFVRNRSGFYVILSASGFEQYTEEFDLSRENPPIIAPPQKEFTLTIRDPNYQFLPRQFIFSLPRNAEPKNINSDDSVFQPIYVRLFPSPTAESATNWAVIHASLKEKPDHNKDLPSLPWALIEITPHEHCLLANRPLPEKVELNESNNKLHLTEFEPNGSVQEHLIELDTQPFILEVLKKHIEDKIKANIGNKYKVELSSKSKLKISSISSSEDPKIPIQIKANPALGFSKDTPITVQSMADSRGEALVAVPGLPIIRISQKNDDADDATYTIETDATLSITFNLNSRNKGYIPNPDQQEGQSLIKASMIYPLSAGREQSETFLMKLSEPANLELLRVQQ